MNKPPRTVRAPSLFASRVPEPLASRLRPRTLDEYAGQRHLLAPGMPLRESLARGVVDSMILWGPPGVGKTTLARLFAQSANAAFVSFSAVSDGVARVREVVAEAEDRRDGGRSTILFVDEIHRFNRGQQDAFLPHVESGTIILVGATTENPSFALTGALLSRTRVLVLEPIGVADLVTLVDRALSDNDRGLGARKLSMTDEARSLLAEQSDGDARRLLGALEAAATLVDDGATIQREQIEAAIQRRMPQYDKSGEEHYNLISALHKAVRGSDPQAALYWLARMIEGGEDPRYLARRLIRMAAEDIGLADPPALAFTISAAEMYERLGSPEGELALAEAAVYLATAPKSNKVYEAWGAALEAARNSPAAKVPLHIRNAPTGLMKELGYGAGYQYAHAVADAFIPQDYLPDSMQGATFYEPGPFGFERDIAKRLAWWAGKRGESHAQRAPAPATTELGAADVPTSVPTSENDPGAIDT
jgi:putative ATPase